MVVPVQVRFPAPPTQNHFPASNCGFFRWPSWAAGCRIEPQTPAAFLIAVFSCKLCAMPSLLLTSGGEAWMADAGEHSTLHPPRASGCSPVKFAALRSRTAFANQHRGLLARMRPTAVSLPSFPFCAVHEPLKRSARFLRGISRSIFPNFRGLLCPCEYLKLESTKTPDTSPVFSFYSVVETCFVGVTPYKPAEC